MMICEELKKTAKQIKLSEKTKNSIIESCYLQISEKEKYTMKKAKKVFVKTLPLVAVMAICVISAGVIVANHSRGFKDVKKGTAVVGTVYEEATEMVKLNAETKENLIVSAEFADYDKPPYVYLDVIDINNYKIFDSSNNVICKGNAKSVSYFENGKVTFEIPTEDIPSGKYKLVVNEFLGSKKADQPLTITGLWECEFVK